MCFCEESMLLAAFGVVLAQFYSFFIKPFFHQSLNLSFLKKRSKQVILVLFANFKQESFQRGSSSKFISIETPFVTTQENAKVGVCLILLGRNLMHDSQKIKSLSDVIVCNRDEDLVDKVCDFKSLEGRRMGGDKGQEALVKHISISLGNPLGSSDCMEQRF